jgi:uncharacterized protein (DUF362 family)
MTKGISISFRSYSETIPKLLELVNLERELKKHSKIVLKPFLSAEESKKAQNTNLEFVEEVLKFCLAKKNPVAEVFIAEGADGADTMALFNELGYNGLAEKYSIGLVDLNNTETEPIVSADFLKFSEINYPKILKDSFVISLPKLAADNEFILASSLSNMLGAYPARHYKGFFSRIKSRIRKWSIRYSIHDIIQCKEPNFSLVDASEKGKILAGFSLEVDKQAAKLLSIEWKNIGYLRLLEQTFTQKLLKQPKEKESIQAEK